MTAAVLFDLDGTLVDTAPDLGHALNLQLEKHGKNPLPLEVIRPYASHGSQGLLGLAFNITPNDNNFIAMREEYLACYASVLTRSPALFAEMDHVLNTLNQRGVPWGIVTNKPGRFTTPIVEHLGLDKQSVCVVSGDDAPKPKPSPATLFLACKRAALKPAHCLYVGDAARDVTAGKAAGMKTVIAMYGYIDEVHDTPTEWGADASINTPTELLDLISS